jgi:hypothetical protein
VDPRTGEKDMTREKVSQWVAKIWEMKGNSEVAHAEQDNLYEAVLSAIANKKTTDPAALAREALQVRRIDFERWYA